MLWTPEGFYDATPGAESVLKWVVNHGPDSAATTLPVSAIAKLHRPNALPLVLIELETARALGLDDITKARLDVQAKTGSAKPPGGVLHVLAIGVDKFGDKAGGLHLDYAAEDAHDVATALLESQKGGPGKASLYANVEAHYLPNDKADSAAILDALDAMALSMAKNEQGQDVAVILVSSHGEMIDGQFYLIPYGFDAGSQNRSSKSAISASEFARKVRRLPAWQGAVVARRLPFWRGRCRGLGERSGRQGPSGRHGPGKRHRFDLVQKERAVGGASGMEARRPGASVPGRAYRSGGP